MMKYLSRTYARLIEQRDTKVHGDRGELLNGRWIWDGFWSEQIGDEIRFIRVAAV